MPNRIAASGFYDDKTNTLFCSDTDQAKQPCTAFHHPQPGVYRLVFDPAAFADPIIVLATSTGVASRLTTDASAFVRTVDRNGCEIVTVVFDRQTNTLITQNSSFYFTIIEHSAGFSLKPT